METKDEKKNIEVTHLVSLANNNLTSDYTLAHQKIYKCICFIFVDFSLNELISRVVLAFSRTNINFDVCMFHFSLNLIVNIMRLQQITISIYYSYLIAFLCFQFIFFVVFYLFF